MSDKLNLIHREGFDSSGKVTGLNLFNPIVPTYSSNELSIYRILGSRKMMGGPINYATGLTGYSSQSQLENVTFTSGGQLVLFDGNNTTDITVNDGSTVQELISALSGTWLSLTIGQHNPESMNPAYRLYFNSSNDLRDTLVISSGGLLERMGFKTKEVQLLTISDLSKVEQGNYTLSLKKNLSMAVSIQKHLT